VFQKRQTVVSRIDISGPSAGQSQFNVEPWIIEIKYRLLISKTSLVSQPSRFQRKIRTKSSNALLLLLFLQTYILQVNKKPIHKRNKLL